MIFSEALRLPEQTVRGKDVRQIRGICKIAVECVRGGIKLGRTHIFW